MKLYKFQEDAIAKLEGDRHICRAIVGSGKGAISLYWAKKQGKPNVLVVSTASKRDVKDGEGRNDFEREADLWFPGWRQSLNSFEVISWQGLMKWWAKLPMKEVHDYAFIFDEVSLAKAGISSIRGKAFLQITNETSCWTGYTATPGDTWIDFYAYFTATNRVKNKTAFKRDFCQIQTYRGFPEIVGYNNTELLKKWWGEISCEVDTSEMLKEMPSSTHKVIEFDRPKGYKKFLDTREHPETGEFVDTIMGVCHTARQMCCTKQKLQWVEDFISGLDTRAVLFYNYIEEGNKLEEVCKKVMRKDAKLWRIDGANHDIPTDDTVGKHDIVLCQWTSGSMGLNLQFINYWVSVSPNYSYSVSEQGRGRIKRIGQERPMFFFYLRCRNSIEEDIYKALKNKSDFAADVWCEQQGMEGLKNDIDKTL